MINYIVQLKRAGRSLIDPLPTDFCSMYFLYPAESGHMKGFRNAGPGKRIIRKIRSVFPHEDESKAFRMEKVY